MGEAQNLENAYYTTLNGCPIKDPQATLRIGDKLQGTLLIRDINLIEIISHATHERIPERIVHAKGAGARGYFEVTNGDIANYSSANFLSSLGKKTDLRVRFSTVAGGRGSADTVRDTRGFAFKLYTDEGNLDWLFFSEPVFPIRDGGKFPSFMHALKGTPKDNIFDPNTFWQFFNTNPEAYHTLLMIFSDRGTPEGYQYSDIFGLNTYKFTKDDNTFFYVKIHMKPSLGVNNMTASAATTLAGEDPDALSRSLFQAIEDGKLDPLKAPSWEVSAQIMTPEQAQNYRVNIFDPTKVWSQKDFPLIPFGKITLTDNPENYFQEVEQIAFNPTAIVPGWDVTPDPILQTRLFAYGSTQRYRLGINFMQNSANRPKYSFNPTIRDGAGIIDNLGSLPNYIPGDLQRVKIQSKPYEAAAHEEWVGRVTYYDSVVTDEDYVQPRDFWQNVLSKEPGQQDALVENISCNLVKTRPEIQAATIAILTTISPDLGTRVATRIKEGCVKKSFNFLL